MSRFPPISNAPCALSPVTALCYGPDTMLAIDDIRVTPDDYDARIQRLRPGAVVELTLARHKRLFKLSVEVQQAIPDAYAIITGPNMKRRDKQRLEAWLGQDLRFVD